jgi:hypothetical protein
VTAARSRRPRRGTGLDVTGRGDPYLRIPFTLLPDKLVDAVGRLAGAWAGYRPSAHRVPSPLPLVWADDFRRRRWST